MSNGGAVERPDRYTVVLKRGHDRLWHAEVSVDDYTHFFSGSPGWTVAEVVERAARWMELERRVRVSEWVELAPEVLKAECCDVYPPLR